MRRIKPILYYISYFIVIMGFVQFIITAIELRKVILLNAKGDMARGVVIDKFIQERFQGPQTGYRLSFTADSLNLLYSNHFFKSYNDNYNRGDTLSVIHFSANPDLSCLFNFRDEYSDVMFNLGICIALLLAGRIGIKKHEGIKRYLKGR